MTWRPKLGDEYEIPYLGVKGIIVDLTKTSLVVSWEEFCPFTGRRLAVKELDIERVPKGWLFRGS